jgi:alpha-mannosidase
MKLGNEFFEVTIFKNGQIDLKDKRTGHLFKDVLNLEDHEDAGDSYRFKPGPRPQAVSSRGKAVSLTALPAAHAQSSARLRLSLDLPTHYDRDKERRGRSGKKMNIDLTFVVQEAAPWVEIRFEFTNVVRDHRLRALIRTGFRTDFSSAGAPYEVVTRDRRHVRRMPANGDQPNTGFVDISENGLGLAVLNEGLYEYQHRPGRDGVLALTLLRANEVNWKPSPGNQCLRSYSLRMALYPHAGDCAESETAPIARDFQNPLLAFACPADRRKYKVVRPGLQEAPWADFFFRPDPFAGVILPREAGMLALKGRGMVVTALKPAEDGKGLVVRAYNSTGNPEKFVLSLPGIKSARLLNLEEKLLKPLAINQGKLEMEAGPFEILTIGLEGNS